MLLLKIRLAIIFANFIALIAWNYFLSVRTAFLYSTLALLIGWITLGHLTSVSPGSQTILYPVVLESAPQETETFLTETEIRRLLLEYDSILEIQPNHRDVLVNTAILYQSLGEVEKSQSYWQQAALLDPNHQIFTRPL